MAKTPLMRLLIARNVVSDHPTLLRRPNPAPLALPIEDVLPGAVGDYRVTQVGDAWSVVHAPSNTEVYAGRGPVEVLRSQAPF